MKQVLIIAYHYPPSVAVGAIRPSKFVRYLPQFGWNPTVLTLANGTSAGSGQPGEGEPVEVAEWPHPLKTYEVLKERWARRRGRLDEVLAARRVSYNDLVHPTRTGLIGFKRWLLAFSALPDRELVWVVPAVWRARQLIRAKGITHVVTTAPPWSSSLVGLALRRLTSVRWVADFRDPWSLREKFPIFRNGVTDHIEARLIRAVVKGADLLVSARPEFTERALAEHPRVDPRKFVTLTNGFDPADFEDLLDCEPGEGPIVLSYLGTFYGAQSPEPFLRALRAALDDGRLRPDELKVEFVGNVSIADGQLVADMLARLALSDVVTVRPPVALRDALAMTRRSDVSLVFTERYSFSSKVYNLLASGSMILNVGSPGPVMDLLAATGRGLSADYRDEAAIAAAIVECVRRARAARAHPRRSSWRDPQIAEFSYDRLAGSLAAHLERLGSVAPAPQPAGTPLTSMTRRV